MDEMNTNDEVIEEVETELVEVVNEATTLNNYTAKDILEKCEREEVLTSDIPYENVRNNSKIFLIYYAKKQLKRVIKLSDHLEKLEDNLIANTQNLQDPESLLVVINSIERSLSTALALIDKISTNDEYVKLVLNDNRQIINNINTSVVNNPVNLTKEQRAKIRGLADSLLTQINNVGGTDEQEADKK